MLRNIQLAWAHDETSKKPNALAAQMASKQAHMQMLLSLGSSHRGASGHGVVQQASPGLRGCAGRWSARGR